MADDEKFRKQMLEEVLDFWEMFIYGNPTGSLSTGNNNETNLRHVKRLLGISELEALMMTKTAYELNYRKLEKKIELVINEKVWWREEREETLDRIEKLEGGEPTADILRWDADGGKNPFKKGGEKSGAKERKDELTSEPIRRNPEVNVEIQPDSKPPFNINEYRAKPVEERRANYESRLTKDGKKIADILDKKPPNPWSCSKCGIIYSNGETECICGDKPPEPTDWDTPEHWKIDRENAEKIITYDEPIIVEKAELEELFERGSESYYIWGSDARYKESEERKRYFEFKKKYLGSEDKE